MDEFTPQIVAFHCSNCAASASVIADGMQHALPGNVKVVQVPCSGRIEILHLLKPFEEGADGVYVAGCQEDSCQYTSGISKATRRVAHVRRILEELDIDPERIAVYNTGAAKGHEFTEIADEMTRTVKEIGPVQAG